MKKMQSYRIETDVIDKISALAKLENRSQADEIEFIINKYYQTKEDEMQNESVRHYYAGLSDLGVNFTYDSGCWTAFVFDNKEDRDNWIEKNRYNDHGNIVAEEIDRKTAYKIAGIDSKFKTPTFERTSDNAFILGYRE